MSKTRELDNGMYVMDVGYRNEEPIALVERTFRNGTKEYIIAFNYEIEDNSINWGYGYYYSDNIEKAKNDFSRVLKGENLADTFDNNKKEFEPRFYTEDEIKDLIKSKAELYYVDDGIDEAIIKFEDIPDFIVDYNRNFEMRNLKFFKVGKGVYEPDITTMGEYLDRINPDLRERMIDRLIALQTNEAEIKKYKIVDEDVYAMFDDKYINEVDKECEYEIFSTIEKSHGRIEKRTCYVLNELAYFTDYLAEWKGLKKIFAVKREVERNNEKTTEISCYLSSKNTNAENLLSYTRKHWQIESMHHILDVTYDEDRCKLLTQRAQENINIFRKMGISIHKNYLTNKKQTVKSNMFNCLLNDIHLLEMLQFCNNR